MTNKIKASVSEKKIQIVKKLEKMIKDNKTIVIASIKNLPSRQFQSIRKKLRGTAEIIVVKKNIMLKAIEASKDENLTKLQDSIVEDSAILFSKEDAFELGSMLARNKNPIGAKPGQIATDDIEVQEGATDIMPGPAISEFSNLGIKIAVEEGKIAIKQNKVIVKSGEKIDESAASIMSKLGMTPFKIGLEPIALYEIKEGKIYKDIKINPEKMVEELKICAGKSLGFAQRIGYFTRETIGYLLAKANSHANAIARFGQNTQEIKSEEN